MQAALTQSRLGLSPPACACRGRFPLRWKHVVIHAQYHRDENDAVVEEMQFDPGNPHLDDAHWYRRTHKVMPQDRLSLEERMLHVVPELNDESNGPPLERLTMESLSK